MAEEAIYVDKKEAANLKLLAEIERYKRRSDEDWIKKESKRIKFRRTTREGRGLKGKYKPEVIAYVKGESAKGKSQTEIGHGLMEMGMTNCQSPNGWCSIVKNIINSPEYQNVVRKQMEHISKALDNEGKYEEAPLKDLINAQCSLAKTFGGVTEKEKPEDGGKYTINLIQFKK